MSSIILLLSMQVDEIMGEELIGGRESEGLIIYVTMMFHIQKAIKRVALEIWDKKWTGYGSKDQRSLTRMALKIKDH